MGESVGNMDDFWVFGYGSLMWNPGFFHDDAILGHIYGYHRSLCLYSIHHRGTTQNPGLILGLDRGGSCLGMGFHVPKEKAEETYHYLLEREQPTLTYHEKWLKLFLANGQCVKALAFVANRQHKQYAGLLTIEQMAEIIRNAHGVSGLNTDYVLNTVNLLRQKKIHDAPLERLSTLL